MKEEYEVVISGMYGRFPNCSDQEELKHCLLNKINCIVDEGRWPAESLNVPHQVGTMKDPYFFDLTFFGMARKIVQHVEPNLKHALECAVSAIYDAGVRLNDISGSDTATFSSFTYTETDNDGVYSKNCQNIQSYAKCMQANRIAYFMNLKGPSFVVGADWNGSLIALKQAKELIASGRHKAAIVASSNFIFVPEMTYHFNKLGRLSQDGKTKSFSDDADGYSRSEGCVAFFLQRKEDALRSYGTLLGVEISPPGMKSGTSIERSLPDPSFLKKCYETAKVDPASISYLEASGCATKTLDAKELNTLSEILLPNRKTPLLIGSIKSNIGHGESVSAFFGIAKLLIAGETSIIPPNLHYSSPNNLVPALLKKKLKVVTEPTPLEGDLLAINNLSAFGGVGHAIIKRNTKSKKRQCQVGILPPDGIPRLVLLSSRVEEDLHKLIDKVEKMPVDEEFIALTHRTFGRGIKNHLYRGYTIIQGEGSSKTYRDLKAFRWGETRRPVWAVFTGMGAQWPGMAAKLMTFPIFANSIRYCHSILQPLGVDLIDIVTNPKPDIFDEIFNCFVGIAAVQIGLVDLLKGIDLKVDGIIGHSVGEVVCSYLDGSLTAEQALLTAYYRGKISAETNVIDGLMAAVGMGYTKLKDLLPDGIEIACRNSARSCTISGPVKLVEEFVNYLDQKGIFVRTVKTGCIAYHSRYIQEMGPSFLEALRKVIPDPKKRSSKWISSSVPEKDWDSDLARYSSAEYHAHNLLNPVLFEEAIAHIPKDAVIIEVAPRDLLKAIITRALPSTSYIPLTTMEDRGDITFLTALGSLHLEGINANIEHLYPAIEFPVSRGTPSLSPFITWVHNELFNEWNVTKKEKKILTNRIIDFNDSMSKYNSYANHRFKGTAFLPSSSYIELVIEMFKERKKTYTPRILLKNIAFSGIIKYGDEKPVLGSMQVDTGHWEFIHRNKEVATGTIEEYFPKDSPYGKIKPPHVSAEILSADDVLLHLAAMGFSVNKESVDIQSVSFDAVFTSACAVILWKGNWLAFLDSLFIFLTLFQSYKNNKFLFVNRISHLFINLEKFSLEENKVIEVFYNSKLGVLWSNGLELHLPLMKKPKILNVYENYFQVSRFVAFERNNSEETFSEFSEICVKIVLNNIATEEENLNVFLISKRSKVKLDFLASLKRCNVKASLVSLLEDSDLFYAQSDALRSYSLILNDSTVLENSSKTIQNSRTGFLICKMQITIPNLVCITEQTLGDETYYFYKAVKYDRKEYPLSYVTLNSPQWLPELKEKLLKDNRTVYVFGSSVSHFCVQHTIEQCTGLRNANNIRFVFLESIESVFNPEVYKDHLRKNLRVNVLKNGEWGTWLFYPIHIPLPIESLSPSEGFLYRFKDIKAKDIHIHALGLNLTGVTEQHKKLGLFEFSGTRYGRNICGLATINEDSTTLKVDEQFVWDKPSSISHEDVASSLLSYAMACYFLEVAVDELTLGNGILVHNAEMPLCQAVIYLALKKKYDIFMTYDGEMKKKKFIRELFPQIPEDNLLRIDEHLPINLMLKTNGQKMRAIINTVENKSGLLFPTSCLGSHCLLFQLSSGPTKPGNTLGLRTFLVNTLLQGFGPESLLNLPEDNKQLIWKSIESMLKQNELKPLNKTKISPSTYNTDAVFLMKDTCNTSSKFVVNMTDALNQSDANRRMFACKSKKCCVIFGKENQMWFDLIQWLLSRGVRYFIIGVDKISEVLTKRLNILLKEYEFVKINLFSAVNMDTEKGAINFINEVEKKAKIEIIFAFGKEYCEVFNDISTLLPDIQKILIGKRLNLDMNDKSVCQKRLAISVPHDDSDLNIILQNLDSILNISEPVLYMVDSNSNSDIETIYVNHWGHLPDSIEAFVHLASSSGAVRWKEVRTNTLPYSHAKDVPPVFIIPPLNQGQLDQLIQGLFHPAFVAVIPPQFKSIEDLAENLYKALENFDYGVFTVICADWSYHIGLSLGRILEKNGKQVSLMLLSIDTSWVNLGIVDSIFSNINKFTTNNDSKKKELFQRGFKILKHHLEHVLKNSMSCTPKYQGLCRVLVANETSVNTTELRTLRQCCQEPIKVHCLDKGDYLNMINSREAIALINSVILVEHKDSCRPASRNYDIFYPLCTSFGTISKSL